LKLFVLRSAKSASRGGWKAAAWICLVIAPLLLLLLLQFQFLSRHLASVTWVQRFAVLIDVLLIWLMWPMVLAGRGALQWPRLWLHPDLVILGLIPIGLAFTAATYPGEWLDEQIGRRRWIPLDRAAMGFKAKAQPSEPTWTSIHDLLFDGTINPARRRRATLFSNTLVLPGFDVLDSAKHKLDLRRRRLEGAQFTGADLSNADLRGAYLKGAVFFAARLEGVCLENADLQGAVLEHALLTRARLEGAKLQNARLGQAWLEGAVLDGASLQGASLNLARLNGASLQGANLQGASIVRAWLQGASLEGARLQGALLDAAQLQGASLVHAELQGASLNIARLQGASLERARLQSASLDRAQLQGASLGGATLLGTNLTGAQLQGASFAGALLQGADFRHSDLTGTDIGPAEILRASFDGANLHAISEEGLAKVPLLERDFLALQNEIANAVPAGPLRDAALKRIEILNPRGIAAEVRFSPALDRPRTSATAYSNALASQLKALVCSNDNGSLYILRGLIRNGRIAATGAQAPALTEAVQGSNCSVSATLGGKDMKELKMIERQLPGAR